MLSGWLCSISVVWHLRTSAENVLLPYTDYGTFNLCWSEDARISDVISEAYFKVFLDKSTLLSVLKDLIWMAESFQVKNWKYKLASFLLLTSSDKIFTVLSFNLVTRSWSSQNAVIAKPNCPSERGTFPFCSCPLWQCCLWMCAWLASQAIYQPPFKAARLMS